ncbi:hypothetical protein F5X99DRAFT_404111 [Biscogniauxia marginata]|nr:hypothetical protein F5X99DRAFT_404111 [Biscogniauxia marginata]
MANRASIKASRLSNAQSLRTDIMIHGLIEARKGLVEMQTEVVEILERQGRIAQQLRTKKYAAEILGQGDKADGYKTLRESLTQIRSEMMEIKKEIRTLTRLHEEYEETLRGVFMVVEHS